MTEEGQSQTAGGSPRPGAFWGGLFEKLGEVFIRGHQRGTAILYQSGVEEALRTAIAATFHATGAHSIALIGGGDKAGSLGFKDQCRLAFSLGLFGDRTLRDMDLLAKIRNTFAHNTGDIGFDDPPNLDRCLALKTSLILKEFVTKEMMERQDYFSLSRSLTIASSGLLSSPHGP